MYTTCYFTRENLTGLQPEPFLSRKQGTIPEPSTSHIGKGVALVARTAAFVYMNLSDSRNDTQLLRNNFPPYLSDPHPSYLTLRPPPRLTYSRSRLDRLHLCSTLRSFSST